MTNYATSDLPTPFVGDDKTNLMRLDINKGRMKEDVANIKKWRAMVGLAFAHNMAKLSEWNGSRHSKTISESLMAKALLHIRRVVKLNTFHVTEMKEKYFAQDKKLPLISKSDERHIGLAIYAGASMFNHSCMKNASYFFTDGGGIVVVASDVILPGEEIFISYPFCEATKNGVVEE